MRQNRLINNILNEVYEYYIKDLLTENKESKMRSLARKYSKSKGYSDEQTKNLEMTILHDIPNARLGDFKFFLGVTRLAVEGQLSDGQSIMKMNQYLKLLANPTHINEYDNNLNAMSFSEIDNRFATIQQQFNQEEIEKSKARQFTENCDYKIVKIPDAETASQYGEYTSWCVTHSANMYDSYTGDGLGLFYFCLKNGFENVLAQRGENCPLDEYGLSMIAVSVNYDGSPNTITCRWNHDCGGNDNVMTPEQLEQIIGRGFYKTFLPRSQEEIQAVMNQQLEHLLDEYGHEYAMNGFDSPDIHSLFDINEYMRPTEESLFSDYDEDDGYDDDREYEYELDTDAIESRPFCYENEDGNETRYIIVSGSGDLMCDRWFYDIDLNVGLYNSNIVRLNSLDRKVGQYNLYDYQQQKILIPENVISYAQMSPSCIAVKRQNNMENIVNMRGEFVLKEDVIKINSPSAYKTRRSDCIFYCSEGPFKNMQYVYVTKPNKLMNIIILHDGQEYAQLFKSDVSDCYTNVFRKFIFVQPQNITGRFVYLYDTRSLQLIYKEPVKVMSQTTFNTKNVNQDGSVSYSKTNIDILQTMDGKNLYYYWTNKRFIQNQDSDNIVAECVRKAIKYYFNR